MTLVILNWQLSQGELLSIVCVGIGALCLCFLSAVTSSWDD